MRRRFVPAGDVPAWRDAINLIHSDAELRLGLGQRAADLVRSRFTYRHMWSQADELLRARNWV